jgi:hypothetical protein
MPSLGFSYTQNKNGTYVAYTNGLFDPQHLLP